MERESLASSVAFRLEQALHGMIAEGRLAGGERLPSVRQLTLQFGVSRNTVQAALRGLAARGLVRSLPRQGTIVLSPEKTAVGKKIKKANQIGVIDLLSSIRFEDEDTESWYQGVIRGAEHVLACSNYHLVKTVFLRDQAQWVHKIWRRIDAMTDGMAGVILYADIATNELLSGLDERGIPWVTVGRRNLRSVHNFVAVDHLTAGQLIGWTFAQLGYQKLLYLGWNSGDYSKSTGLPPKPDEKFLGLVQGYIEGGGDTSHISVLQCSRQSVDIGYEQTQQFISKHGAPQGVFAFTDHLALGALRALRDCGIDVPREAGVVGSMGTDSGQYSDPPLTVVNQPIPEMGQQVTQLLLEMIRGDVCRVSGRFVPCEMIFRGSLELPAELRAEVERRQVAMRALYMKIGM
ncbi:MAG: GntR family transcriptional regulator [Phycisphaerales bacterium]|nr:GntR family transcriptional regulator [Phycisphaerales bacterium]